MKERKRERKKKGPATRLENRAGEGEGKCNVYIRAKWPISLELIPASVA